MNYNTVPNQKTVIIHRDKPDYDFLQIKNEHWMEFNKKYGPFALQLYLYLAKNKDGYPLALSPQAALNEAGIKRTSFYDYLNLLIKEGYLIKRNGNTYDFYETPFNQGKIELETECPPYGGSPSPQNEQGYPPNDCRSLSSEQKIPQASKEIYNRYTDNLIDTGKDIQNQKVDSGNSAKNTENGFVF